MPESTIYPTEIEIDIIKNGQARLLCHWNIEAVIRDETIVYQYEEAVFKWALPKTFTIGEQNITISTRADVELYIQENKDEIVNFAKATLLEM
jgi:hypothetical protein